MLGQAIAWLESRTGVIAAWQRAAQQPISGGARLLNVFSGLLIFLFVQQAILGLVLAGYYSPSASDAWASVAYLNDQVTGGWFVRGLHHHASSAMIVIAAAYVASLIFMGGYKGKRELVWLSAMGILLVTVFVSLSGALLPWDDQAVAGLGVETSILKSTPGGDILGKLLIGGSEFGNLTILKLYSAHVLILPALLGLLLYVHRAQLRRHGFPDAHLSPEKLQKRGNFLGQMFLDMVSMTVVVAVLVFFTFKTHGAELYAPAEIGSAFDARPEWYFRSLNELLKYFDGPLQVIGTMVIPGATMAFILGLPWIDRAQSARLKDRLPVVAGASLVMVGVLVLTGMNLGRDMQDEKHIAAMAQADKQATRARELAEKGVLPLGGDAVYENDPQVKVRRLFKEHCQNCHMVDGIGGDEAPDFTDYRSRDYLTAMVRDINDKRFFGGTKHEDMDAYPEEDLSNDDLKDLVEWLIKMEGTEGRKFDEAMAKKGFVVFDDSCSECHEYEKGEEGSGPHLLKNGSKAWLVRAIKDTSKPDLFGENATMPKFEGKLSDEEMDMLAEFILDQRVSDKPQVAAVTGG